MTTIINSSALGLSQRHVGASGNLQIQTANVAAMTLDTNQIVTFETTGAINLPAGTTAQRPTVVANGAMRYNTTINSLEGYIAGSWQNIASSFISGYVANVMIVAGGGSGGGYVGGGGAGGGVVTANIIVLSPGTTYSVVVGTGNVAPANTQVRGSPGLNSSFSQITAYGGGSGGTYNAPAFIGGDGGSGGGNNGTNNYGLYGGYGRGITGQGNPGGYSPAGATAGCGGGGAGAAGSFSTTVGGIGGTGTPNTIPGSTAGQLVGGIYYVAGGGGGNNNNGTSGAGGNGGGGAAQTGSTNGTAGTANTGGGGGGAYNGGVGGNGGSGVVVLSIPTSSYSGNSYVTGTYTYTIFNSFTILGFTSNGSYTA